MEKWQVINEFITKQIQVNSDTAQLYVLYGAIALGLITFALPRIREDSTRPKTKWFNRLVIWSIVGLSLGAAMFFWLSRSLTLVNREYPAMLYRFAVEHNLDIKNLTKEIEEVQPMLTEPYLPLSRCWADTFSTYFHRLAKGFFGVGFIFYLVALCWYIKKL